jgi:catechol 2,3-dioxygenase-like lactoylglutathione lyase family enzyme
MIQAKRIGHATLETPDLDRLSEYYQEVVGLVPVERSGKRVCLASNTGQLAIVLEKGSEQRCTKLAFEISPELSAGEISKGFSAHGLKAEGRSDPLPGISKVTAFTDSKGTTVELFQAWNFLPIQAPAPGAGPNKLGHVAWVVHDPKATADFYEQVLGFRTSDWIGDYFVFLRCGVDHHTVNFIRGPHPKMHHMAFELRDAGHLHNACDLLGRKKIEIVWGPVRHGPGHNVATYHRNPDDHMVEFFIELDKMLDEELGYFDPRPWHGDRPQRPKVWDPNLPRDKWGLPPGPNWVRQIK